MEAGIARRTWIQVQKIMCFIVYHPEDMRMAANEYLWLDFGKQLNHIFFVMPRITSYVGHKHCYFLTLKNFAYLIPEPQLVTINVTVNSSKGFELFKFFGGFEVANIASVPNFVAVFKEFVKSGFQTSVCIAQNANFSHDKKNKCKD